MKEEKEASSNGRMIDFGKELTARDGEVLKDIPKPESFELCPDCQTKVKEIKDSGIPLTFKSVCVGALDSQQIDETGRPKIVKAMDKLKRAKLARKIYDATMPIELSLDELSLVRDLVGENCIPMVIYQVWGDIDPKKLEGD